ncbi:hypothetical protein LIZ27_06345 [Streptococcus parasanguinis]|uniref:hypothetical protein n=1 Tax=Streptococcus parasanguinis TaxID=1318 RepID=UPI001D0854FB|nr:hypothetical protein [Streptococcus parasanguinis]MCB6703352.1 hypothetical protein [Streptococcus parasanguinis]MCB6738197.1 hypothetical protein [Streptococcus parasanguinis]MCB7322033.1 hypothetical protein [Streptococcus parasanguinis]MCB7401891.1 hypothetical protein [Streptococcus parasanguinis]
MPVDKNKKIEKILNTPTLNLLPSVNSKTVDKVRDPITNRTSIHLGTGTIHIENFDANKDYFKLRVLKMLDLLILLVGKKNQYELSEEEAVNCLVEFSIKQYAKLLGKSKPASISTKKNVRRIIEEALSLLNDLSISTKEKRGAHHVVFNDIKFIEEFKCENGIYTVQLTEKFVRYLITSYVSNFPLEVFKIDERSKNVYSLAKKLVYHQSNKNNRRKKTNEIISVEALLNVCPQIPPIEEVRLKKCGWRSRIEESFANSLDKLIDDKILVSWEYCNPNCEPLSDEQLEMNSFFEFQKFRIHFKVSGI